MQAKTDSSGQGSKVLTLQLKPPPNESLKPQELIQVKGHSDLTLYARRAITLLYHNAHRQGIAAGKDYKIELDELKTDRHKGYDVIVETIELLMTTLLIIQLPNGSERRVQFLGGNDITDKERKSAGVLTYSFDKRLTDILERSAIYGQISLPVVRAFTSKYAVSLYENISQKVNLTHVQSQQYSIQEFREMVGVKDDRYPIYGDLNRHVIKPAVAEINLVAPFHLSVLPIKRGKKVEQIKVGWQRKEELALHEADQEVKKPKAGRRARAAGTVQMALDLMPSSERLARQDRLARTSPKTS